MLSSFVGWKPSDQPYMTTAERSVFQSMRQAGRITFFRTGACESCGADVPQGKRFCCYRCMVWMEESLTMWEPITSLEGKRVAVETTDGCQRHGVLTKITWAAVNVDGCEVKVPIAIGLDNEPGDELPWNRLKTIAAVE